jgi:hypothetical protein
MPLSFNQIAVSTAPTMLANVSGPFNLQITLGGTVSSTIYLGTSNTVTSSTGAHVNSNVAWQLSGYSTTKATQIWGVTASGTVSTGVALSTPQ